MLTNIAAFPPSHTDAEVTAQAVEGKPTSSGPIAEGEEHPGEGEGDVAEGEEAAAADGEEAEAAEGEAEAAEGEEGAPAEGEEEANPEGQAEGGELGEEPTGEVELHLGAWRRWHAHAACMLHGLSMLYIVELVVVCQRLLLEDVHREGIG
eukprot:363664-Chlamydomonas_euryale.AAC.11